MRYPNSIRTPASAARRAGPTDHDVKVKQRHRRAVGLVALSRQVHGETFEITKLSQSALVSRTQDVARDLENSKRRSRDGADRMTTDVLSPQPSR